MTTNAVLEINRHQCGQTRLVESQLGPLSAGQVRLRVDRFAVTANNITYAVLGDMLGYWDFFPTGDPAWGRVPAMGWADVIDSTDPDVAIGGRYYGWFPMARFVDLTVSATADGLRDDGEHRQAHAPVYRSYVEATRDPMYPPGVAGDEPGDAEDRHALLRGLFLTGLLSDTFLADADYHGADAAIVLSASAKTAVGFAQRAAERGLERIVGLTSPGNVAFVRSLGWYTDVLTYDDIASLPEIDAVLVDISGDGPTVAAVHDRLGDHLKYSMIIGKSHHDAPMAQVATGPIPEMFFARPRSAGGSNNGVPRSTCGAAPMPSSSSWTNHTDGLRSSAPAAQRRPRRRGRKCSTVSSHRASAGSSRCTIDLGEPCVLVGGLPRAVGC